VLPEHASARQAKEAYPPDPRHADSQAPGGVHAQTVFPVDSRLSDGYVLDTELYEVLARARYGL
jgi:hypothetical protein